MPLFFDKLVIEDQFEIEIIEKVDLEFFEEEHFC